MKRALLSIVIALLLVVLGGLAMCTDFQADRRVISPDTIVVGPGTVTVMPAPVLRGIGPVTELCLRLPGDYEYRGDIGADSTWKLRRPDGPIVGVAATLVSPDGTRHAFEGSRTTVGSPSQPDHSLCFESWTTRDPARRFDRIELQSADSVHVLRIHWYSGERFASL